MTNYTSTALITGGTSGIGRATANKLAQLSIRVVVVGLNAERGKKTVDEIRSIGGKADFISSDLRDAASARDVAKRAIELANGQVDILINNAGIYPFGATHEMTEEQFDRVYSLNVKAPYFLVAERAPLMARRGKGAIVNRFCARIWRTPRFWRVWRFRWAESCSRRCWGNVGTRVRCGFPSAEGEPRISG